MANDNLKKSIYSRIDEIAKASASLKTLISIQSRELLEYVPESKDIGAVNRFLEVLNKGDRAMCIQFFKAFLPWKWVDDKGFTNMYDSKVRRTNMLNKVTQFLAEPGNNVFTYQRPPRNQAPRTVNYTANLKRLVETAVKDETPNHISKRDVFEVVVSVIGLDTLMAMVTKANEIRIAEAEKAKAAVEMTEKRDADAGRAPQPKRKTPAKVKAAA